MRTSLETAIGKDIASSDHFLIKGDKQGLFRISKGIPKEVDIFEV